MSDLDSFKGKFRELFIETYKELLKIAEADKAFAILEEAVEDVEEELYDELIDDE